MFGELQPRPLAIAHSQPPLPGAGVPETVKPPLVSWKFSEATYTEPPAVSATVVSTVAGAVDGLVTDAFVVVLASM